MIKLLRSKIWYRRLIRKLFIELYEKDGNQLRVKRIDVICEDVK